MVHKRPNTVPFDLVGQRIVSVASFIPFRSRRDSWRRAHQAQCLNSIRVAESEKKPEPPAHRIAQQMDGLY